MQVGKSNIYTFNNKDVKTYIAIAEKRLAEGDLEGALSFYLECEKKERFPANVYKKIANLYTDLQMYEKSILYWYKLLCYYPKRYKYECYNALGANYYFLGQDDLASHYFNLQISKLPDKEYPYDEVMLQCYHDLISAEPPKIRLVDTQGDIDDKKIMRAQTLFESQPQKAYDMLKEVEKTSSKYYDAMLTLGAFYMIDGDYLSAIDCYKQIPVTSKNYDFALNNLLGAYFCANDSDNLNQILVRLKKSDSADLIQLVKFYHLLNDKKGREKCYNFSKLLSEIFTGPNTYFYRGVSAYNFGKYEEAEYFFTKYYKITGDYYLKYCIEASKDGGKNHDKYPTKLCYEQTLDDIKIYELEQKLEEYLEQSKQFIIENQDEIFDFATACFDTQSEELQAISSDFLCTISNDKAKNFLKEVLVNPKYADSLKTLIITALVIMGNNEKTGVVFDGIYEEINFDIINFPNDENKVFYNAYAFAFGRVAALNQKALNRLKKSAEELRVLFYTQGIDINYKTYNK